MHSFRLWLHAVMKLHPGIQEQHLFHHKRPPFISVHQSGGFSIPWIICISKCDISVSFGMFLPREWF